MVVYSHSRLSTYEQCPLKYKYKYIDKEEPRFEQTIEAHLGKTVHDTLELIYTEAKEGRVLSLEEVMEYYTHVWRENFSPEIFIVKENMTEKDYFTLGVEFLLSYYNEHAPFKDGTIECEKRIWLNLDEEGDYKIIGFIDRLVYNFETGEYEIHDYKTANTIPSRKSVENDRQLALYSIAIKEFFGQEKQVRLIWHYLAHNTKVESTRTNEQLRQLKEDTMKLIEEIESAETFPHKKSALCHWCEFKHVCPAWKDKR